MKKNTIKTNLSEYPKQSDRKRIIRKSLLLSVLLIIAILSIPVLTAQPFTSFQTQKEILSLGISNLKPDIDPNWQYELISLAIHYSEKFKLPTQEKINGKAVNKAAYLLAQIWVESHFIPGATSVSNAQGLMQVKPATGRILASKFGYPKRKSYYNIHENINLGIAHMNSMIYMFGSLKGAAYAYNIGSVPYSKGKKNDFYWDRIHKAYNKLTMNSIQKNTKM